MNSATVAMWPVESGNIIEILSGTVRVARTKGEVEERICGANERVSF